MKTPEKYGENIWLSKRKWPWIILKNHVLIELYRETDISGMRKGR
jgi:hypothetical protein